MSFALGYLLYMYHDLRLHDVKEIVTFMSVTHCSLEDVAFLRLNFCTVIIGFTNHAAGQKAKSNCLSTLYT